ncbi:DUF1206 domain-containing protein [Devosia sp. RR2S18]|uniref:DUF1206 domain-containing protein n=1 Tax=Devosia rhizosphaerae TaxID=3049774 RepID=UPI00253F898F|nr:DUF1206 domain-containing protein [Devosia sp. RR2S18]WIJ24973.1 DUF1206 domain-containing protein [Devosia sp. RR2S18]
MQKHIEIFARFGYAARGFVYMLLGGTALFSVIWGIVEDTRSLKGSLGTLLALPAGRIILGLIAVGLAGHVVWRLLQGFFDADEVGRGLKGWFIRAARIGAGVANATLAAAAAGMALALEQPAHELRLVQWLSQVPLWEWWAVGIGATFAGVGINQVRRGLTRNYDELLRIPPAYARYLEPMCSFGLIARGAVFLLIGGLLISASFGFTPVVLDGTSAALDYVHRLPWGSILYGVLSGGLMAFGGYSVVEALYRRVDPPSAEEVREALPG